MIENEVTEREKKTKKSPVNRVVIGSVIGASIGWLSSPETGKKVFTRLRESEMVRNVGRELGRTAQEIITEQAVNSFRQRATDYLNRDRNKLPAAKTKKATSSNKEKETEEHSSDQLEALKEENKKMSEQLQMLEQKINEMNK